MTRILFAATTLVLLGGGMAHAAYVTLVPPGATASNSTVAGVSGNNVVGSYSAGGVEYGFLYDGSAYTTIDFPGSTYTSPTGVSGDSVVGYSVVNSAGIGFLYNGGSYATIVPPGGINGEATAISGNSIVDYEENQPSGTLYGYVYNGGAYTIINNPAGSDDLRPVGISGNYVVGNYREDGDGGSGGGFLLSGSALTTFTSTADTITMLGVSGNYAVASVNDGTYGILYNISLSTSSTFSGPPGTTAILTGANDAIGGISGSIVFGSYNYINGGFGAQAGFLYNVSTSAYTTIAVPGARQTLVTGVDGNIVVGYYEGNSGTFGFEYTPTPGSWASPVSGNWSDYTNWSGGVPDGDGATAIINESTSAAVTATLDVPVTLGTLILGSGTPGVGYTLPNNGNTLTFSNTSNNAPAQISVADGAHSINAPVVMART